MALPDRPPAFFAPAWRFSLGLALGFYPALPPWGLRLLLAALGLGIAVLALSQSRGRRGLRLQLLLVLAFFLGLGAGSLLAAREEGRPPLSDQGPVATSRRSPAERRGFDGGGLRPLAAVGVEGRLLSDSTPARGGLRSMGLEVEALLLAGPGMAGSCSARGRQRLLVREGPALASGTRIRVWGEWGKEGGSPAPLFADRRALIVLGEGGAAARLRNSSHEAFVSALGRAVRGAREGSGDRGAEARAGLLMALLAGWQDRLSPADEAAFRGAGCTHVLALSGQHLALIAAGLVLLLRPLLGPRRALVPALALAALYVLVVGPGPSLLRALLSFGLAALATLVDRPQDGRSLLGLTFALHALLFPDELRSAGLVLSYLAVGGLVVLGPRFEYLLRPLAPPFLATALAASLAAQAATGPWIAFSFGIFQPVGILATVVTAPLVEAVMVLGLGSALGVGLVPPLAALTAPILSLLLTALSSSMALFATLPSLALPSTGSRLVLALAIGGTALFLYARPHADHRRAADPRRGGRNPARLRRADLAPAPPRRRGARDVEAPRTELPDQVPGP